MNWRPLDIIAMVVAGSVSLILIGGVLVPLFTGNPHTDKTNELVAGAVGSFISFLLLYCGNKLK